MYLLLSILSNEHKPDESLPPRSASIVCIVIKVQLAEAIKPWPEFRTKAADLLLPRTEFVITLQLFAYCIYPIISLAAGTLIRN
jgi:hypothetical protein